MSVISTQPELYPMEGGCPCGNIRYRMERAPLIVHCCHCTWCRRETGSAFALNAMLETRYITILSPILPTTCSIPSASGAGQTIHRCPSCHIAVCSEYGPNQPIRMIRVGTLDRSEDVRPGVHIYVSTKMHWVNLAKAECKVFDGFYDRNDVWGSEALERRRLMIAKMEEGA
ncbi:glutathione-dependent formaldehyde-activating, GFA [Viridothelium virens]|uniref:Glutathione-dependent formaldehyde-activating, GFA n=1 Tax=Viridothelium virens TaxID=1048519 RepID=A0A6A6GWU4_VIRVR|nr:glutathione-dependent formaldehyde-activating, GFA [Viridothelium virens]